MFNKGEKIVYGQTGVCVVEDICEKQITRTEKKKYYTLKPLFQNNNLIFIPVDNTKVFMRKVITKEKAEQIIDLIPSIKKKINDSIDEKLTMADYKTNFESHDFSDLIEMLLRINQKKISALNANKRLGFIDEKYLHKAEELVNGELSVAIGIKPEEVQKYILEKNTAV